MAALLGDRRTYVLRHIGLRHIGAFVACALGTAACTSGDASYQEAALRASENGDLKGATSLAQKEVEKFSASDQCSTSTNYNCGTLALAYSSLAEYQIRGGNTAAGERSFDRAKGVLVMVPADNKPSATGMVFRDVSEAFWKAGNKQRAIAVFKEGRTRGADEWLYTSSAAKAVAEQEGKTAPAAPSPGAPAGSDTKVNPILVNNSGVNSPAVNDPTRSRPPASSDPAPGPASAPTVVPLAPLAPSPLTPLR